MRDISEIYDELTDKQQANLLEKLAGKRQGQIVAAILNNFDTVEKSLVTMANSTGSAMNEMGIVEETLEYKLNKLSETGVGISQNLFKTDEMSTLIGIVTGFANALDFLTEKLGLFGTALTGIGIFEIFKNIS